MKEPVYSMELGELPGTRPRVLKKERNVGADKYIQAYLSNEKLKTTSSDIKMRNPLFSDFQYAQQQQFGNGMQQQFKSSPQLLQSKSVNPEKVRHSQRNENLVEDSIDQFQRSSLLQHQQQQNQIIKKSEVDQNYQQDQPQLSSKHNSRKSQNYEIHSNRADANEYYQKLQNNLANKLNTEREQQRKLYVRNNVLGSKEYYIPQYNMDVKFSLYDRPKFKDYTYSDASYKEVVELKNRYQLNEMMNNEFVTTSKDYGYGLKGYTKVPIYPSSKPQNIDKE
ncbi:unnamed protein product (macronuclear) [Paramecium tetraurelia]|uniref:Uncharacterized protein n=1 Tax=Paramecium tetraurelia TaxID=5888 RepID=A0CJB7_PARTE|nr:uncharacterized protein GSPATT00000595001 [Paramecium tetraurelia]CAK70884.1 unnamed protein product [Paramecium tetraurelia]|eukprot:XP_001438281.1 hypothetical protein (macronuclear) [Paramecium tetraurelia strain d4-2]